jgi:hypothetical protein
MSIAARIECDSVSPTGKRLTTVVATYPRFMHAQVMTHRVFARNVASSRAIPVAKMIGSVVESPYLPAVFRSNGKGMQPGEPLPEAQQLYARHLWLEARDEAVRIAGILLGIGVHKQWVNRLLEPFAWVTTIITATEWAGFFAQRIHGDVQDEFHQTAICIRDAIEASTPAPVGWGQWHLPFTTAEERESLALPVLKCVSAARSARVSYLTHDGTRSIDADLDLFERLRSADPPHASPFEHVATPCDFPARGCFVGWRQFRHELGLV